MAPPNPLSVVAWRGVRLLALALFAAVAALAGVEVTLQLAVRLGAPSVLADPEAYAHPLCDPWFWRTRARQARPETGPSRRLHPVLGWIPPANRTGVDGAWRPDPAAVGPPVVLFGDSFVAGTTGDDARIASRMQRRLDEAGHPARIEDRSVGGYGLDQTLLRFLERAPQLPAATPVVIGVLTTDIDRTLLAERDAPKPRYILDDQGVLELETAHLTEPIPAPAWRVLVLSRLRRARAGWSAQSAGRPHPECRVEEKTRLARALLTSLARTCEAGELRCLVVPFLREEDLVRPAGWRERLLEGVAPPVEVLRLRPVLASSAEPLFGRDRHPNATQNRLVADALAAWVRGGG
ncbi:MAG: SGNH/GDSL hydrolase family protein [Myxococcota bacterium]|nr:SGNH/GDSL hydrolase family protein [Myxococcota bacterium]